MKAIGYFLVAAAMATAVYSERSFADTPSAAGDDQAVADARCLLVGIGMGSIRGVTPQTAGIVVAVYYLGRLDAHTPALDLESLLGDEAKKMSAAEFKSEAIRCGNDFQNRGKELQDMGARLGQRAKQQQSEPQQQQQQQ